MSSLQKLAEEFYELLVQPDGGLYSLSRYTCWDPGSQTVTLDDNYTAEELRVIADHMDRVNTARSLAPPAEEE